MNPKIPHCQRCGTSIPPEEAVPYLDAFGRRIPSMYRNWCITHWAQRLGALPPSHPDFFKPIDARTRRKDKQYLSQMVGYASLHGMSPTSQHLRSYEPSPAPSSEKPVIPYKPSVSNILARAAGMASMFPEFEEVGRYLLNMKDDDLADLWRDLEEKAHG